VDYGGEDTRGRLFINAITDGGCGRYTKDTSEICILGGGENRGGGKYRK